MEVEEQQLLNQIFTIYPEQYTKHIWVVGSTLSSLDTDFTIDSDIDIYLSTTHSQYTNLFQDEIPERPYIKIVTDHGTTIRQLDTHLILHPDEKPKSARNRPVKQIY